MKLLSIGEFSRLVGLSVSALRFYAESDILLPARVDQESGYRYYSPDQIPLGQRIAHLRRLDFPLADLALLLRDPAQMPRLLEQHEQRLYQQFQHRRLVLREMSQLLSEHHQLPEVEAVFRTWPAQQILSCTVNTEAELFDSTYRSCVSELHVHAEECGVKAVGMDFGLYHAEEFWGGALQVEVCLPVEGPCAARGQIRSSNLPETQVACALHLGHWSTFSQTFAAVFLKAADEGRQTGSSYTLETPQGIELGFFLK